MNVRTQSNEELKKQVKKAIEARKIVRKTMDDLWNRAWDLKQGKYKLDWLISESREELGRRKASKCGAMKQIKDYGEYLSHWSCLARDIAYNRFYNEKDLFRKHCCTCRWKPSQAKTRMVILRIKNGRQKT